MLREILVLVFLALPVSAADEVMVGGEVEKPGRVELSKGSTLNAVLESAVPSRHGAVNRVRVFRGSTVREYDLSRFPHVGVEAGDVIVVPQKAYVGDLEETHHLMLPGEGITTEKLLRLLSGEGRIVRENWRSNEAGIEVRPANGDDRSQLDWVHIRMVPAEEIPAHAAGALQKLPGYRKGSEVGEITISRYAAKFGRETCEKLRREGGCRLFQGWIHAPQTEFLEWPAR